MNSDKLVKSSKKIQDKWLGYYDESTFGSEIADNDIGYFITQDIEQLVEEHLDDDGLIEEYEVFKNLNKKELKTIKRSSLLTDQEIEDLKKTIVEQELYGQSCNYIWYSLRECEGEKVFVIFSAENSWPDTLVPSLYGIFKSIEDARQSLINTNCYIDETQKHYF